MSKRHGEIFTVRQPTDGGAEPNKYNPEITVEIRVVHPPHTPLDEVATALSLAVSQAFAYVQTPTVTNAART